LKSPSKVRLRQPKALSLIKRRDLCVKQLSQLAANNPRPHCELYYRTPYQLLVSVVLSAQTTDKSVNKCMQPLYDAGFTPETVLKMGAEELLGKIRTIGLAPTKARNVARLTRILVDNHGGQVPRSRDQLEALPGVGRKTANVVLAEVWRDPVLAVDTHVFRVTNRLGLQRETSPEKAELELMKVIPQEWLPDAHHWFILHGRYTCKALRPECATCILRDLCPSCPAGA
jgi:endonuclease-3